MALGNCWVLGELAFAAIGAEPEDVPVPLEMGIGGLGLPQTGSTALAATCRNCPAFQPEDPVGVLAEPIVVADDDD